MMWPHLKADNITNTCEKLFYIFKKFLLVHCRVIPATKVTKIAN